MEKSNTNVSITIIDERQLLGKDFKMYGTIEEPLFLAKDVAKWIEHANTTLMVSNVDKDEQKLDYVIDSSGQRRKATFLTEDGLYEVLMQSRKPIAKQFKTEVKKILRTIRKTGGYVANDEMFINAYLPNADETTKGMFKILTSTINQLNSKIDTQKPLVEFAEHVSDTKDLLDMAAFAKVLHNKGVNIGRTKLFAWLRDNKYLRENNEPYQQYINNGYLEVRQYTYISRGEPKIGIKPYVTGKGEKYFYSKLKETFVA